jgi:acetamidase/formamidase
MRTSPLGPAAFRLGLAAVLLGATAVFAQEAKVHDLPLEPEHVHWGYYDSRVPPALRIRSGDSVRVETMVARGVERLRLAGVGADEIPASLAAVEAAVKERGPGAHPLTGPIFVEGAEPGDVLEVHVEQIGFLHPYGVGAFSPRGGTLPDDFPYAGLKLFRFDAGNTTTRFAEGIRLTLAPFFGSIGVAPPVLSGRLSSGPPDYHAGNLDNKELGAGSTVFLPVHVPGALLSIGDGHALQGDGEVSGTAIETSLSGRIRVVLRKNLALRWPRAETTTHVITMGLDPDLDEAVRLATREMVDWLVHHKGLTPADAYILCSVVVDLRVTQTVDGTKGIHAMLPKSIFTDASPEPRP